MIELLLGEGFVGLGTPLGRSLGIALIALGLACWPGSNGADGRRTTFRAMLVYNGLIAIFLAYLGGVEQIGGVLLWPAALLHGLIALPLAWKLREG